MLASQLDMWRLNIRFLIGLVMFMLFAVFIAVCLWTGVRIFLFRRSQCRAAEQFKRTRTGTDGRTAPPMGTGLCDKCGKAGEKIYFLPDGVRRCEACYRAGKPAA